MLPTAVLTTTYTSPKGCPVEMADDLSTVRGTLVLDDITSSGIVNITEIGPTQFRVLLSPASSEGNLRELSLVPSRIAESLIINKIKITARNDEGSNAVEKSIAKVTKTSQQPFADGSKQEELGVDPKLVSEKGQKALEVVVKQTTGGLGTKDKVLLVFQLEPEASTNAAEIVVEVQGCFEVGE